MNDRRAMERALVLARRGLGSVRPNPPVGAVVLREGQVVGEGFHPAAGEPHAEILALRQAGDRARGGTLVVTLEPCNHQGRTGPCVDAIVAAGIRSVQVAIRDPNPQSGDGLGALQAAGVETVLGPCTRRAAHLLAGFSSRVERRRPRFAVKVAAALDGRIATADGDSRWISSDVARAWVHRRRREADAILIGAGTAVQDNPALTTRSVEGRSPDRFVVDSRLRVRPDARLWSEDGVRRVAVTTGAADPTVREELTRKGVEIWELAADDAGRVDLDALALRLGEAGYTNVLVEGGGMLVGGLLARHLADVVWLVLSRSVLLGGGGAGWTDGLRVGPVARAPRLARTELRALGPDWLVTLVPEAAQWWDPETWRAQEAAVSAGA